MTTADLSQPALSVSEALRTLRRRLGVWTVGSIALTALALLWIALIPNEYRAMTTILVDPQKIPDRYVSTTVSSDPSERLNSIKQEVLSQSRLQQTIDNLSLYQNMRSKHTREEIVDYMRSKIEIEVKQSTGQGLSSFTISFSGSSPALTAKVTNQLAASFIDWNLASREQQAEGTTEFLDSQLTQAKQNLELQEAGLRQFKMLHLGETPDELQPNLQTLSRLQVQLQATSEALNRAESERIMLTRAPQVGDANLAGTALSERARLEIDKQQTQKELANLKRRYTASHPDVLTLQTRLDNISSQLAKLPADIVDAKGNTQEHGDVRLELVEKEIGRLHRQQDDVEKQIATYQHRVEAVPVREQQLTELTRNYEISKQHYQSLLDKTFSAGMAADLERKQQGERFTILDKAQVPERPYKPKRLLMMVASGPVSALLLAILLIVLDVSRTTIKSEEQLKKLIPAGAFYLGTTRPIVTPGEKQRRRWLTIVSTVAMLSLCFVTALLLWKIHPVL